MEHQRSRSRRVPQAPQPERPPAPPPRDYPPSAAPGPLLVRFLEEDDADYLVGDPWGDRTAQVPKRRTPVNAYPSERGKRRSSERLVRWSWYALIGVIFGGVLGVALGCFVLLGALVRLTRLSSRVRRWRRRQRASGDFAMLPTAATQERIQLLAALGQSVVAMLLGSAVLVAILMLR